ncbi:hypothetical protein L210DRAFT_3534925 [Boletus edulis BED1]|uniref:YEATS domain-containing protein n=1 Tax=Boletus edulis BED1 TaxID=1328754 RepID=A0AAD4BY31_BOLED|nr:hypothetical protein L210DRAFT_3534925 [Boletus edulis BED1]
MFASVSSKGRNQSHTKHRWVRMYHSPIPCHVNVPQPGAFKRKRDPTTSDGELDVDSVGDDHGSHILDIFRRINDEVNLEVAIRERLATTIEGRIQWALRMLDALSNVKEPLDQPLEGDDFQDAALDALEALEAPSSIIFDNGLPEERSPSPSFSPVAPNQPTLQRVPKTRSSRTPKPSQQKKHLFIKLPSSTSDSQLAILDCPICNRTQFTNLQGLLNHARLAHGVEWASHDACITACAVPVSADAQSWEKYEKDGVEVPWSGSVVGLRRLFERAVGVDSILPTPPSAHPSDPSFENPTPAPSTLLSRTLGLHADSPALAQFLGRAPKRRCIHVYDEDQHVNITTLDSISSQSDALVSEELAKPKKGFHMHYPHRNTARKDLDLVVDVNSEAETVNADSTLTPTNIPAGTTASRFHIMTRIRLEDRSLFLKEDLRTQLGITDQYRWMLGVTSPSYVRSIPLSSFLTCLTVIPPRIVSPVYLTAQQPPFAVVGIASEPFMSKVIFEWVGGGKMEVEHWVELDQSRSSTSVFGSEQLLDVELDRNIPLLSVPKGSPPPLPSLDRFTLESPLHNTPQTDPEHGDTPTIKEEYYEQVLRSLLPRVPMTAKGVKSRMTVQVPYRLVASPAHLFALVPGRRKAIEWARARALHALYMDHMTSVSPSRGTTLTVGDVYMFLEDGSHFPRPSHPTSGSLPEPKKKGREKDGTPVLGEESCPTCGMKKRLHPGYDLKSEKGTANWICAVVPTAEQRYGTSLPLTNLSKLLTWPDGIEQAVRGPPLPSTSSVPIQTSLNMFLPPFQHTSRDLATLNPPELILAVHRVASKLRLPAFPDLAPYEENHAFLSNRECTERYLAPAALLSAALKPFISTLLQSAIEIAKRDATSIVPGTKTNRGKRMKKLTFTLTPGHILRGLRFQPSNSLRAVPNVARTTTGCNARESTALCLARFGVRPDFGKDAISGSRTNSAEHSGGHAAVKAEPE